MNPNNAFFFSWHARAMRGGARRRGAAQCARRSAPAHPRGRLPPAPSRARVPTTPQPARLLGTLGPAGCPWTGARRTHTVPVLPPPFLVCARPVRCGGGCGGQQRPRARPLRHVGARGALAALPARAQPREGCHKGGHGPRGQRVFLHPEDQGGRARGSAVGWDGKVWVWSFGLGLGVRDWARALAWPRSVLPRG